MNKLNYVGMYRLKRAISLSVNKTLNREIKQIANETIAYAYEQEVYKVYKPTSYKRSGGHLKTSSYRNYQYELLTEDDGYSNDIFAGYNYENVEKHGSTKASRLKDLILNGQHNSYRFKYSDKMIGYTLARWQKDGKNDIKGFWEERNYQEVARKSIIKQKPSIEKAFREGVRRNIGK